MIISFVFVKTATNSWEKKEKIEKIEKKSKKSKKPIYFKKRENERFGGQKERFWAEIAF